MKLRLGIYTSFCPKKIIFESTCHLCIFFIIIYFLFEPTSRDGVGLVVLFSILIWMELCHTFFKGQPLGFVACTLLIFNLKLNFNFVTKTNILHSRDKPYHGFRVYLFLFLPIVNPSSTFTLTIKNGFRVIIKPLGLPYTWHAIIPYARVWSWALSSSSTCLVSCHLFCLSSCHLHLCH